MPTAAGTLTWRPAAECPTLLADPVAQEIDNYPSARVAEIDPELADTEALCAAYDVALEASANCIIVAGKRGESVTYAAVMVLATDRADINSAVRRHLGVRKISFAPMDHAVETTGMEYGGITPIGLPQDWPVLMDTAVSRAGDVVIGSGLRRSKILVTATQLAQHADVFDLRLQ